MAKRRPEVVILLDILTALLEGPKVPTRLAQACNLSYDNFVRFVSTLEAKGLVQKRPGEGRELYAITPDGFALQGEFRRNLERLGQPGGASSMMSNGFNGRGGFPEASSA